MFNPRTVEIDGIGPVLIENSRRARRIIIYVRPFKGVRVAVPGRASFKEALAFVKAKKPWIMQQFVRMRRLEKQDVALTESFAAIDQVHFRKRLSDRLFELASKHGFCYGKLSINHLKSRWGSCSQRNNISLNLKLAVLPQELIDYVILHELVHTRVHNHSEKFWTELDKYVEDARAKSKRLRLNCPG